MEKVFVRHTVKDFEKWIEVFHSVEQMRRDNGELGYEIFATEDDPNHLLASFDWDELEHAKNFFASEDLKAKMDEAGVSMSPQIFYCHKTKIQ